ncbi:AI-2E family transporter [Microbacterium sp. 18062]|uniref:AI-2E family transporter n=1 Tax=Microbacterium sp. 18062 TaxID=2681410 RepID=UPI00135A3703|nr:AI-2E family transporter [Microbacterium sp. 18062]
MTDAPQASRGDETAAPAGADVPRGANAPRWRAIHHPFAFGFFVTLGGLIALVLGLAVSNLSTVIIYVVFALFAALGLDPIVRTIERRGLSRAWGIVIVYVGFAIVLAAVLMLIIPTVVRQISQFVQDVPSLIATFQRSDLFQWLQDQFGDAIGDILTQVQSFLVNPTNIATIGGGVLQVGVTIVSGISGAIIILVLSLYFLASLPAIKQAFYRLVPAYSRPRVAGLTEEITDSIGGYLMGMVILAFCNATFVFLLFLIVGLPFPLLLAVVAFCITLIPLVGTVLFWVIGSVVALFADPVGALVFAAAYLVYMQLEAYLLTPRIMNRTISIPGALVVIGALVGGTLLGLLGALVAIPVTASLLLILKRVLIPRQDAKAHVDDA